MLSGAVLMNRSSLCRGLLAGLFLSVVSSQLGINRKVEMSTLVATKALNTPKRAFHCRVCNDLNARGLGELLLL